LENANAESGGLDEADISAVMKQAMTTRDDAVRALITLGTHE